MGFERRPPGGAIVLAVLAAVGIGFGQYDPSAPEPPVGRPGSLVVAGPGPVTPAGAARFTALATGDGPILAVLTAVAPPPAPPHDAPVADDGGADRVVSSPLWGERRLVHVPSRAAADDPGVARLLDDVAAAWIPEQEIDLAARWAGTALARALGRLMDRGGVVGAHGQAAGVLGTRIADENAPAGLGLLPGGVLVTGNDLDRLEARLKGFLPAHRHLVGYAVPSGATLHVDRRRMTMVDATPARALIAPWREKPWRVEVLDDEHWMDLVLLGRAAVARTRPPFPPARPPLPEVPRGTLILAGGAGVPEGLLERFVAFAGGPDAPIVFIPPAGAALPNEPSAVDRLREAGARNVTWIHTHDRRRADEDEAILGPLREARGIWFGGGRHWHFVDSYQNTAAHRLMHDVLDRGGVIGGWSAGASIQSDYMTRGDPRNNRNIMAEGYERGLGFLPGTAVDQHFSERDRLPEMAWLVSHYPQLLGIGLDERTALIVRGRVAEVVADSLTSRVYFFGHNRPTRPSDQRYEALVDGERYDLVRRGRILPSAGSSATD